MASWTGGTVEQALELEELTQRLADGFREAEEAGAEALNVQLRVPFTSQYEWRDDYGAPRSVHLPTDVVVRPVRGAEQTPENGGPAATFEVRGAGHPPDPAAASEIGRELLRRSVLWGQAQYGSGEPLTEDAEPLPEVFVDIVEEAFGTEVNGADESS